VRSEVTGAEVLKLERKGNRLTMSAARVGAPTRRRRGEGPRPREDVYVGLFVCAHNPDVVETVVFENVRLARPEPDSSRPSTIGLGSRLELLVTEGRQAGADPRSRRSKLPAGAAPGTSP